MLVLTTLLLLTGSAVLAQSGDGYQITRWGVPAGADQSVGDLYALDGAAGQTAAGEMSGGDYDLGGGFWGGGTAEEYTVFLPLILRN